MTSDKAGEDQALVDIAFNITDEAFMKRDDYNFIIERAESVGVTQFVICGGSLEDSAKAIELCERLDPACEKLFVTVGVHPTRCNEFLLRDSSSVSGEGAENEGNYDDKPVFVDPASAEGLTYASRQLDKLKQLIEANRKRVVGYGEFGLDYDREHFCTRETQQRFFTRQLDLLQTFGSTFPLYLHIRGEGCANDLLRLLEEKLGPQNSDGPDRKSFQGVAHSFTGTHEEAKLILGAGLDIGINGCGLKTEANCEVVRDSIPIDRMHLETDAPYCDIRNTHFSSQFLSSEGAFSAVKHFPTSNKKFEPGKLLKSRNEPCRVLEVAQVVAGLKGITVEEVRRICGRNSRRLFGLR